MLDTKGLIHCTVASSLNFPRRPLLVVRRLSAVLGLSNLFVVVAPDG